MLSALCLAKYVGLVSGSQLALELLPWAWHILVVHLWLQPLTENRAQVAAQPLPRAVFAPVILAKPQHIFLVVKQVFGHVVDKPCVNVIQWAVPF